MPLGAAAILGAAATLSAVIREGGELAIMFKRLANGEQIPQSEFEAKVAERRQSDERLHGRLRDIEAGGTGRDTVEP